MGICLHRFNMIATFFLHRYIFSAMIGLSARRASCLAKEARGGSPEAHGLFSNEWSQSSREKRDMRTVALLTLSNLIITFPWYSYLKFRHVSLWLAMTPDWHIAFFEYCPQMPANRYGYGRFTGAHLRRFRKSSHFRCSPFSLKWNVAAGFVLICRCRMGDFQIVNGNV